MSFFKFERTSHRHGQPTVACVLLHVDLNLMKTSTQPHGTLLHCHAMNSGVVQDSFSIDVQSSTVVGGQIKSVLPRIGNVNEPTQFNVKMFPHLHQPRRIEVRHGTHVGRPPNVRHDRSFNQCTRVTYQKKKSCTKS